MTDPSNAQQLEKQKAQAAMVLQLAGLGEILIGIAVVFVGPLIVTGMDEIWWIVGALVGVFGLGVIWWARRMDPRNKVR